MAQCRNDVVVLKLKAGQRTGNRTLAYVGDEWGLLHVEFDISSAIRLQQGIAYFLRIILSVRVLLPLVMSQMTPHQREQVAERH